MSLVMDALFVSLSAPSFPSTLACLGQYIYWNLRKWCQPSLPHTGLPIQLFSAPCWASHSAVLCPMDGYLFHCSLPHGRLPIPLFSAPCMATYSIVLCPMNGYLFHCSLPHGWLHIPLFSPPWMATYSTVLCPINGYLFRCSLPHGWLPIPLFSAPCWRRTAGPKPRHTY